MADVFLSYARLERQKAEAIKAHLEARGLSVFFDVEGLDGGDVFPDVLDREVKSAGAVVSLWSPHSLSRPWVRAECRIGQDRGVLIPVVIQPINPMNDVPVDLYGLHRIDFTAFDGRASSAELEVLFRAIARVLRRSDGVTPKGFAQPVVTPSITKTKLKENIFDGASVGVAQSSNPQLGSQMIKSIIWGLIMLLSIGVGGYALYLVATGFEHLGLSNPMFDPWGLRLHIAASGVAMLLGAFQFFRPLRRNAPTLHRWMGWVYIVACVVGGLAGGSIALYSTAGPIAGWGFFFLAIFWVPFTLLAMAAAMRKDFVAHERWMIRSFALTFGAVTLRIYLPLAIIQNHGEFPLDAYRIIAWAAWVPNLIVAELYIATLRKPRRPKVASTPTPA